MSGWADVVVVFHCRQKSPTYYTPTVPINKDRLELSSKGSSFPADDVKTVPLTVGSLDNEQGQ